MVQSGHLPRCSRASSWLIAGCSIVDVGFRDASVARFCEFEEEGNRFQPASQILVA
jgi:hypothetical protein